MGLDLKLLPMEPGMLTVLPLETGVRLASLSGVTFSHSVLNCERRSDLFVAIMEAARAANEQPVPKGFSSFLSRNDDYEEEHYGETLETPYGEPLTWVRAATLLPFATHEGVTDNAKNRGIWAYLAEQSPDLPVALYWN